MSMSSLREARVNRIAIGKECTYRCGDRPVLSHDEFASTDGDVADFERLDQLLRERREEDEHRKKEDRFGTCVS